MPKKTAGPDVSKKKGKVSQNLSEFAFMAESAPELLEAFEANNIHTKADLIKKLVAEKFPEHSVNVNATKFLEGNIIDQRLKADIVFTKVAKLIAKIAGLDETAAYARQIEE